MSNTSSLHITGEDSFRVDHTIGDLDRDLIQSLITLDSSANQLEDCNQPTGKIIIAAGVWFLTGVALWVIIAVSL
jgi:hypothetical protein